MSARAPPASASPGREVVFCISTSSPVRGQTHWYLTDVRDAVPVLRLGSIVLGADDVERAVAFWSSVFGYEVVRFAGSDDGFTILVPPDRVGTRVAIHRSVAPAVERPRIHVDLVVDSSAEQASEVDRLMGLGATRVPWNYPSNADFVVLADTEGNRFCVVDASRG